MDSKLLALTIFVVFMLQALGIKYVPTKLIEGQTRIKLKFLAFSSSLFCLDSDFYIKNQFTFQEVEQKVIGGKWANIKYVRN